MQQILTYAFLVIYTVTILGIVLVIITDNRNPLKTCLLYTSPSPRDA